ncbi:type II toxin-antitoxin system Phd/YefM family antitoxin [Aeromicrobium sp. CTD01-1L150]|uniref:type II toxin-antitoxin system Phd/YefM family antitoxin n=1 Tax=Aeromicrobium sp. CTD01-1L150 TaxID=3341830 RepID=UPI0035C1831B
METISQREMRNDSGEVIRRVERGESLTVTRRGVPVARLVPAEHDDLRCERPARRQMRFSDLPRVTIDQPSTAVLDDLRGDR